MREYFLRETVVKERNIKMICRMVACFHDTESAQAAARRIRESADGIWEIRMLYRSEDYGEFDEEKELRNNVVYSDQPGAMLSHFYAQQVPFPETYNRFGRMRRECRLCVLAEDRSKPEIERILVNAGGYGLQVTLSTGQF